MGTHLLLGSRVVYLGLLVVDEEQRFGVKQKEKIASFKTSVDVLGFLYIIDLDYTSFG